MADIKPLLTLCDKDDSVLVIIDIQQRLSAAMPEKIVRKVITDTKFLIESATLLNIPIIITEQYSKGLGLTVSELSDVLPKNSKAVDKTCFSCASSKDFSTALKALNKKQVILAGMETHICVTQTALELLAQDYQVFVATDAVCSRKISHHQNAIQRMQHAGCITTNTESISFEWLRDASHAQFKAISKLIPN